MKDTINYTMFNKVRQENKTGTNLRVGGGVFIGIQKGLIGEDMSNLFKDVDVELLFIHICHATLDLYILNIYLTEANKKKLF